MLYNSNDTNNTINLFSDFIDREKNTYLLQQKLESNIQITTAFANVPSMNLEEIQQMVRERQRLIHITNLNNIIQHKLFIIKMILRQLNKWYGVEQIAMLKYQFLNR